MLERLSVAETWYKDGLQFQCTGCGKCCTGAPGYVWVTKEEIEAIAGLLKIGVKECMRQYIRQRFDRYALIELKKDQYDCVFLRDKKCLIYEARPHQCRTFPWWKENLSSPESWQATARSCEGICARAPTVPYSQIEKALNAPVYSSPSLAE